MVSWAISMASVRFLMESGEPTLLRIIESLDEISPPCVPVDFVHNDQGLVRRQLSSHEGGANGQVIPVEVGGVPDVRWREKIQGKGGFSHLPRPPDKDHTGLKVFFDRFFQVAATHVTHSKIDVT